MECLIYIPSEFFYEDNFKNREEKMFKVETFQDLELGWNSRNTVNPKRDK